MKFQRKKVAATLSYLLGVGGAVSLIAIPADAADIRVEVTGSNIKRVEAEGALPVQVITRQDIDQSGATNAYDLLQLISANNSIGNLSSASVVGLATYGTVNASLRGLGGARTLVLVNGKRLANSATDGTAVDLNSIPFSAVERVEILKDGASAIYGSDAIAGVINFILRKDFTGVQATAYYGNSTRGGGNPYSWQGTATLGYGDLGKDKFNIFTSLNWQQSNSLNARDRSFSNTSIIPSIGLDNTSGNTFPANIATPVNAGRANGQPLPGAVFSSTWNPQFPNCAPSIVDENFSHRCRYDPATQALQDLPKVREATAYVAGTWQFTPDWQAYFTASYAEAKTETTLQPNPISDQFALPVADPVFNQFNGWTQFLLPANSQYYPHALAQELGVDGQPLNVRYRAVENGNRQFTDTNPYWQGVVGAKGNSWGWDFDGWFNYNESKVTEHLTGGYPLYTRILPLLWTGNVNPFGPSSPAIQQAILATNTNEDSLNSTLKAYGVNLRGSSDIYKLPAGPLALALGFSAGKDEFDFQPSQNYQLGDIAGYGGNVLPVNQSRTAWAVYGELNIPIVKSVEANVAVRYDHYSDAGNTTNPKVSLRWQPTREVLLRAAWGTGFRAPSLPNLFNPQVLGVGPVVSDPLRCPTTGSSTDCDTQFASTFGGNPDLTPEKSYQTSAGFVFEPVPGVSFGADAFWLTVKNQILINGIGEAFLLSHQQQFGSFITRGPVQAEFPTIPGPITNIEQINLNLGKIAVQGVDLNAGIALPPTSFGTFKFAVNGTYYWKFAIQQPDLSYAPLVSNGQNSPLFTGNTSGVIPRWKDYATLTWTYGPWSATLANTYQSDYIDYACVEGDLSTNDCVTRRVGSLSLWDLQASYTGIKNWNFTLGVKNLADTNPPVTNQAQTFQVGYDPAYYDPHGRFVYGSVTYTFK
jgi:iron complex outermembrane recepter protein